MATAAQAAQNFVPLEEIRNGVVVLKDKSLRAILIASSLNFALKSADEQTATIAQFQNFLNSLEFPIQFFTQSRRLDIRPYVALLEESYVQQENALLKLQIREYIEFVKSFVETANIMTKNFFVVVPYSPSGIVAGKDALSKFFPGRKKKTSAQQSASFEEMLSQLEQRISVVSGGLSQTGVRVVQLGTEELVELFYKTFNPGELGKPLTTS